MSDKVNSTPQSEEQKAVVSAEKAAKAQEAKAAAATAAEKVAKAQEAKEKAAAEKAAAEVNKKAEAEKATKSKPSVEMEKLAKEYAKQYPSCDAFHFTSDGQVFLGKDRGLALLHQKTLGKGEVTTINVK